MSRIFAKISMDGGGGGGSGSFRIKRPTVTESLHKAEKVLSIDRDQTIRVLKNRHGPNGKIEIDEMIEFVADMIVKHKFQGSMDMFQETMKMKIIETLKGIVYGNNIIPKGDILDANTIQRESDRDGSGRNTLLQGFVSLCR